MNGPVEGVMKEAGRISVVDLGWSIDSHEFSILVEFKSAEDMRRAIADGMCTFTVSE